MNKDFIMLLTDLQRAREDAERMAQQTAYDRPLSAQFRQIVTDLSRIINEVIRL